MHPIFVLIDIERIYISYFTVWMFKTMATSEQLKQAYETYVEENAKFVEKGNKAAAGRARKALMELAKLCKARRAEILEEKK